MCQRFGYTRVLNILLVVEVRESSYTFLVFCFFLVKTCEEITKKLSHICKVIDIQSLSSQFCEIIIDYLLIIAKILPKQCPGVTLIN